MQLILLTLCQRYNISLLALEHYTVPDRYLQSTLPNSATYITMSVNGNESCHLNDGDDTHYNHVMLVLGVWQTAIAALAIVVTITFGLINGAHLRTFRTLR